MNRKNKFKGVIAGIEKMPKKPKFKLGEVVSACTKYGDIITGPIVDGPRRATKTLGQLCQCYSNSIEFGLNTKKT